MKVRNLIFVGLRFPIWSSWYLVCWDSKRHTFGAYVWFAVKLFCRLCEGHRENAFWGSGSAHVRNFLLETFHIFNDSRVHTFMSLSPRLWRPLYITGVTIHFRYHRKKGRFCLAWSCPCTEWGYTERIISCNNSSLPDFIHIVNRVRRKCLL